MEAENVPEKVGDPEESLAGTHPGKPSLVARRVAAPDAGQRGPGGALATRD
jgi:hypothetical protein